MDHKLLRKWLSALRGKKYEQGNGQLFDGHSFCCLGVLADVRGCKWDGRDKPVFRKEIVSRDAEHFYLDPHFIGIPLRTQKRLARLNDRGKTFKQIADVIEGDATFRQ